MDQTISTSGSGSAYAAPDAMLLVVSVISRAPHVTGALSATASAVTRLGEVARAHTDADQVRSTGLSVWPHHDEQGLRRGYEARHSLQIVCPGLDTAGDLIDALGEALKGALQIESIDPMISDPIPLATRARGLAFEDARAKAQELAALAGLTLGPAVAVREGAATDVPFAPRMHRTEAASTRLEPGSQPVSAWVSVTWSAD